MLRWPCLLGAALFVSACGTPWIEDYDGPFRRLRTTMRSNGSGNFKAVVKPLPGETAMLTTITPLEDFQDSHVRFMQAGSNVVFRADNEVASPLARTNAGFISHNVSMNWPITVDDGALIPGTNYRYQVGVVEEQPTGDLLYTQGTAEVTVLLKSDDDFSQGTLKVNVIFAGFTGDDPQLVEATEEAADIWRQIYANIGIGLEIEYFDYNAQGVLAAPGQGDRQQWSDIASSTPFGALNLVVVEDLTGLGDVFGFSGDIPGPLVPSGKSAVAVNADLGSGSDGIFSAGEVQLLAETMAHEAGHFLGLYHPVETTWDSWDALADTPDCGNEGDCVNTLAENLMFPFPICDSGGCLHQVQLTPQQGEVANRYTGVL